MKPSAAALLTMLMTSPSTATPVMLAKAGIQQGFAETLDSRMRGNDKTAGCDPI
jgi:hypothetical protein